MDDCRGAYLARNTPPESDLLLFLLACCPHLFPAHAHWPCWHVGSWDPLTQNMPRGLVTGPVA